MLNGHWPDACIQIVMIMITGLRADARNRMHHNGKAGSCGDRCARSVHRRSCCVWLAGQLQTGGGGGVLRSKGGTKVPVYKP